MQLVRTQIPACLWTDISVGPGSIVRRRQQPPNPAANLPEAIADRVNPTSVAETKSDTHIAEILSMPSDSLACENRQPLPQPERERTPYSNYLIDNIPEDHKQPLRFWIKLIFEQQSPNTQPSPRQALSVFNTLFHNRFLLTKPELKNQTSLIEKLLDLMIPSIYKMEHLSLENLARVLGGIGKIPQCLFPEGSEEFFLKQILSHNTHELSRLDYRYLSRMVFGLQNFEANDDLKAALNLIAEAFALKSDVIRRSSFLEDLSYGLQRFQEICPTQLLETIGNTLTTLPSDLFNAKKCAFIISNLKGFTDENKFSPKILNRAIAITMPYFKKLPGSLIRQMLVGLGANANKINGIRNIFIEIIAHSMQELERSEDPSIAAKEIIFACKLYELRMGKDHNIDEIALHISKFIHDDEVPPDAEVISKILPEITSMFKPAKTKSNVHLLDKAIEADIFIDSPMRLNIEIDGIQHQTAPHQVRDKLRDMLLEKVGIRVIRISRRNIDNWLERRSIFQEFLKIKQAVENSIAA